MAPTSLLTVYTLYTIIHLTGWEGLTHMPMSWDKDEHDAAALEKSRKITADAMLKVEAALIKPHDGTCDATMKNWVIKTLCGFRVHVLDRFVVYFPRQAADFVKLDELLGDIIHKCRQANHKNT